MLVIFQILIIILLLSFIYMLLYSLVRGAPYAPLGEDKIHAMNELLQIKLGDKAVDLGAGDGRIIIALAQHGAEAHGYEFNPLLVAIGKKNIRRSGMQGKAFMHWGDMWKIQLSQYNIVTIYLTPYVMQRMEKKLLKEARKGTKIIVNYFELKHWKPIRKKDTLFLYKK
jgi:ubiquinone/menaquinone biosynthesis C-methylase UbiE